MAMTADAGAGPVGILAGGGPLPLDVAAAARRAGRPVHIVAITGFADPAVAGYPHTWASLGQVGRMLASFRRAGCRDLVIAGSMQRPDLLKQRVDLGFFRHIPTILKLTHGGDDSVLRRVVRFFEEQGFRVRGVGDIAPDLIAPRGKLGARAPTSAEEAAIGRGCRLLAALGGFDIGQAVVATSDRIVAVEGLGGTDAMLAELAPGRSGEGKARGGVLVKLPKPGQELRIDLPTIGPATVARAQAAGLAGIAVGAGCAIMLERARLLREADAAGLFVAGVETGGASREAGEPEAAHAPLAVLSRRAPTPAERVDIAIGRRLLPVLAAEGAGYAAVVAGEHVLAVAASLRIETLLPPLAASSHWGWRKLRGQIGSLVIGTREADGTSRAGDRLTPDLFRSARDARLAGIVCLGGPLPPPVASDAIAWANEARLFLLSEAS